MASFKLNLAQVRGLPSPEELGDAMRIFGLAETEEIGVLAVDITPAAVFGTLIRRRPVSVTRLDAEARETFPETVTTVDVAPVGIFPAKNLLEVYAGGIATVKWVWEFLASGLAMPIVGDPFEIDVLSAVETLQRETAKFQLRSVRAGDFAASSYMIGTYAPQFMDTDHGLEFVEQYAASLKSANVRFAGPTGRASVTITPNACFSYACNEDDHDEVQAVVRKLVKHGSITGGQ